MELFKVLKIQLRPVWALLMLCDQNAITVLSLYFYVSDSCYIKKSSIHKSTAGSELFLVTRFMQIARIEYRD